MLYATLLIVTPRYYAMPPCHAALFRLRYADARFSLLRLIFATLLLFTLFRRC